MVKPRTEEISTDGGCNYIAIEKTMKKKKKRKIPLSDEDSKMMVASSIDPSLLVRVPIDNRVNVESIIDDKLQSVVADWEKNGTILAGSPAGGAQSMGNGVNGAGSVADSSYDVALSSGNVAASHCNDNGLVAGEKSTAAINSQPINVASPIGVASIMPQSGSGKPITPLPSYVIAATPDTLAMMHNAGGVSNQIASVFPTINGSGSFPVGKSGCPSDGINGVLPAGECLVFKACDSVKAVAGQAVAPKSGGSGKPLCARRALPRGPGARCGTLPTPNRIKPPNPISNRLEAAIPGVVPAVPNEGVQQTVLRSNRGRGRMVVEQSHGNEFEVLGNQIHRTLSLGISLHASLVEEDGGNKLISGLR